MRTQGQTINRKQRFSPHWLIVIALVGLAGTLGCSLVRVLAQPEGSLRPTRTPLPTFSPTPRPTTAPHNSSPSVEIVSLIGNLPVTNTPGPTLALPSLPVPNSTPIFQTIAVAVSLPATETPWPTATATSAPPTDTPSPTFTPAPAYPYVVAELYEDVTTNHFLSGYIAIVNHQEIPIGGLKAVGVFEPGGGHYETTLSKWFFEGYSAPGAVIKTGSVKFEPPGGIQPGSWLIHLENEWGQRFSEEVAIATNPDDKRWFFIKFKDLTSLPVPTATSAPPASLPTATPVAQPELSAGPNPAPLLPTPTAQPGSPPTVTPAPAVASPTGEPGPTPTATPSPTATPLPTGGWSFANLSTVPDPDQAGLTISGEMINNTGQTQEIIDVTGYFYDSQGQLIAGPDEAIAFWPVDVVLAGERVSFELIVFSPGEIAHFELQVISEPG